MIILVVCLLVAIAVYAWAEAPMLKAVRARLIKRGKNGARMLQTNTNALEAKAFPACELMSNQA
jgi:Mg2+/Co2+ transporter CorB